MNSNSLSSRWMNEAHLISNRSNCIRRKVGAVIVKENKIISRGWNGVSSDHKDCGEAGCIRCIEGGATGLDYSLCICAHAEQGAIAKAAQSGIVTDESALYVNLRPCFQCLSVCRIAGIREVYYSEGWNYPPEGELIYSRIIKDFRIFSCIKPN